MFKLPVERGAENLDKIVKAILEANPETTVVLQTMNVGWDAPNLRRSFSVRPKLEEFNQNYRTYASAHNLPLLDHYAVWMKLKQNDPPTFQSYVPDGTHPSKTGSLATTWPTIKDWLVKSSGKGGTPP